MRPWWWVEGEWQCTRSRCSGSMIDQADCLSRPWDSRKPISQTEGGRFRARWAARISQMQTLPWSVCGTPSLPPRPAPALWHHMASGAPRTFSTCFCWPLVLMRSKACSASSASRHFCSYVFLDWGWGCGGAWLGGPKWGSWAQPPFSLLGAVDGLGASSPGTRIWGSIKSCWHLSQIFCPSFGPSEWKMLSLSKFLTRIASSLS